VSAQARVELLLTLRRGESLVVSLAIPVGILVFFTKVDVVQTSLRDPVQFLVPGVLALAVMSTAMVSLGIATGYERRYGVLKRLGATPLSRRGLIAAKTLTVLVVEVLQAVVIVVVGLALGWHPRGGAAAVAWAVLLMVAATAAFSGLALLMAGTLRAEATLAGANLVYIVLLGVGGVVFPLTKFPAGARPVLELLPTGALSTGLRDVLQQGVVFPAGNTVTLAVWAAVAITLAARMFRWE